MDHVKFRYMLELPNYLKVLIQPLTALTFVKECYNITKGYVCVKRWSRFKIKSFQ